MWALIRAWDQAGRPASSRTVPTFEEWANIIAGIVEYAGFGCPLDPPPADQSADTEADDMLALVTKLSTDIGAQRDDGARQLEIEYTFEQIIETCLELNCFTWMIEGKWQSEKVDKMEVSRWYECSPKSASRMGKLFSGRFGGRIFRLPDGRVIRFGSRGKNRHRRYLVSLKD